MKAYGVARIGRDAELQTSSTTAYCRLSLAFTYGRKGEDGKRPTTWVDAVLYGKVAEALTPYLKKGREVSVSLSEVRMETWTKPDNSTGTKIAAKVVDIELVGKGETAGAPPPPPPPKPAPPPPQRTATGFDDMDDDIPF